MSTVGAKTDGKKKETAPKRRGCLRRLVMLTTVLLVVCLIAAGVGGVWLWGQYQEHVVRNPGAHIERQHIHSIIVQESPVYYRDGTTRVGVFFEDEHRQYVGYESMPTAYVAGLVAAEDGAFWSHPGVNPKGITRAMLQNIKAGGVVAGGSTLTQQTAKNLYYRPDRSLKSKWTELVNALRLEAHFDKTEILTFYANQFHVSGNGRGLGIAALYFFDEDVEDLTVLESAFMAGLVKAPAYYDPFLGDVERRARSVERAHDRTRYVLKRMVDEPAAELTGPAPARGDAAAEAAFVKRGAEVVAIQAEAQRLLDEGFELDFKRGTFRYDSSAVLDEVARRLHEAPFDEVLDQAGIEDPDTAGLVVITTLDPDAQRESIYGLWHHLTEVGTMLEALDHTDFLREDSRGPRFDPDQRLVPHEFKVARVSGHLSPDDKAHLEVDLGGVDCIIDRDAIIRAALAIHRGATKDKRAKVPTAAVNQLVRDLPDEAVVWVSIRDVPESGTAHCDLEVRPELQGAVMVLENGEVRAMVGGNDNRNFNRATALRQMGSTWKPLVYNGALRLGWKPTDSLDNGRNVFPFSTTYYYPRPDHTPAPVVSLSWAGVNSENLASIWLLYHLLDRLNGEQLRSLAITLDLARRADESASDYRVRIQKEGVLPTPRRIEEGFFLQARQEVLTGLALEGHPEDEMALTSLLYGWGYSGERSRVAREGGRTSAWKTRSLDNSWMHMQTLIVTCEQQHKTLTRALGKGELPAHALTEDLTVLLDGKTLQVACGSPPAGYARPDAGLLVDLGGPTSKPTMGPGRRPGRRPGQARDKVKIEAAADMLIDDRLHLSTLKAVASGVKRRRLVRQRAGSSAPDLYDPDVLYWHQDFRVLLAMKYVTALAGEYGVQTPIREVLSMPLGASEITLEESVSVYEGVTTGKAWEFPGRTVSSDALLGRSDVATPAAPTLLISEIRDIDGNIIYQAMPKAREVATENTGHLISDILRNVVIHGTGRRAKSAVSLGGAPVPLIGKTGTTNDFRNAAFLGVAPVATREGWSVDDGFSVGVYVGYDDNRPMNVGNLRLAGSSGALPAWIGAIQGLADAGLLGEPKGKPVNGQWPLSVPAQLVRTVVDPDTGLVLDIQPAAVTSSMATVLGPREVRRVPGVDLASRRTIRPPRIAPRTSDVRKLLEERRRRREKQAREKQSVWDAP